MPRPTALESSLHSILARVAAEIAAAARAGIADEIRRLIGEPSAPSTPTARRSLGASLPTTSKAPPRGRPRRTHSVRRSLRNESRIDRKELKEARAAIRAIIEAVKGSVAQDLGAHGNVAAAAAPKLRKATTGKHSRRSYSDADLDRLVDAIRVEPGLRAEQVYGKAGVKPAVAKKALAKLRALGAVRMTGLKRGATYTAA